MSCACGDQGYARSRPRVYDASREERRKTTTQGPRVRLQETKGLKITTRKRSLSSRGLAEPRQEDTTGTKGTPAKTMGLMSLENTEKPKEKKKHSRGPRVRPKKTVGHMLLPSSDDEEMRSDDSAKLSELDAEAQRRCADLLEGAVGRQPASANKAR